MSNASQSTRSYICCINSSSVETNLTLIDYLNVTSDVIISTEQYISDDWNVTGNANTTSTMSPPEKSLTDTILQCLVLVTGVIGSVANGLVLTSILRQKSTNLLIVNQLVLDLFSSVSVVLVYAWELTDIKLSGNWNVVTCLLIGSGDFIWIGVNGSDFNLMSVSLERYLKVFFMTSYKKFYKAWAPHFLVALSLDLRVSHELPANLHDKRHA